MRGLYLQVGLGRFELPTSRLSGVRSNQLSYRPHDTFGCGVQCLVRECLVHACFSLDSPPLRTTDKVVSASAGW